MASRTLPQAAALMKRTVHVKMYPTARNIAERREVLRVLEQLGEVAMFRSLQYHPRAPVPNAFISMFSSEAAADAALEQSPIQYRLLSDATQLNAPPAESPLGSTLVAPDNAPEEPSEAQPDGEKIFELHISRTSFDHEKYLKSPSTNPLHGPFIPVKPNRSYIAASLDSVIPPSIWAPGLKDWETDRSYIQNEKAADSEPRHGQSTTVTSIEWRVNQRERKRREKAVPKVMRGLKNLRKELEAEQEGGAEKSVKSAAS